MGLGKGKKKAGKLGAMEKKEMPVESDPHKLVNYVCGSNIYTTGEDVKVSSPSASLLIYVITSFCQRLHLMFPWD